MTQAYFNVQDAHRIARAVKVVEGLDVKSTPKDRTTSDGFFPVELQDDLNSVSPVDAKICVASDASPHTLVAGDITVEVCPYEIPDGKMVPAETICWAFAHDGHLYVGVIPVCLSDETGGS